jgi:putative transposase
MPRLPGWLERVNQLLSEQEEEQLRRVIRRSQPFGDAGWVESTARQYNLELTLRSRGRPRKFTQTANRLLAFFSTFETGLKRQVNRVGT